VATDVVIIAKDPPAAGTIIEAKKQGMLGRG
jgi:inorganic pyrophosphatase